MSDLLVTSVTPTLGSGTGLRTYGVVAALARDHPVEVAHIVFGAPEAAPEYAALADVTVRPLHASRGLRRGFAYLRARRNRVPADLAAGVSPELAAAADRAPRTVRVIADGPVVAAALLPLAGQRDVVYLAHNLESGFRGEGVGLEAFERTVLRTFAESWMATRADERGAARLAAGGASAARAPRTRYVPNVVDVARIAPVACSAQHRLLFVADFTYPPNREGLSFLTQQVLPLVWQVHPDAHLRVVGRGLESGAGAADARIEPLGFVEDLRSAYIGCDLVVVPLLHGGGSPLKFIEALAYGLPVVATHHAAALIEEGESGEQFLSAGDPVEFAAAIGQMLDRPDRADRLAAAGRELAARCYSIEALARLLS